MTIGNCLFLVVCHISQTEEVLEICLSLDNIYFSTTFIFLLCLPTLFNLFFKKLTKDYLLKYSPITFS